MNKTQPPQDENDSVGQAYESLLEKALHQSEKASVSIHKILDDVGDETIEIKQWIQRDLSDAAYYLNASGKELKDWLGFDLTLIKSGLWIKFTQAADAATVELLKLKEVAAHAEYHTGEIIGLGTLSCDKCGAELHFHQPGRIPPCGKCHGARFHRLKA